MGGELVVSMIAFFISIVAILLFLIFRNRKRRKQDDNEAMITAMIDSMNMRRAAINTEYLEKDFFQSIEKLIYSLYTLNPLFIPVQKMIPEFYKDWYNELKREYELGLRKQLNEFKMEKAKVVKQENSSMYAVTHIVVEAQFWVDYNLFHTTISKNIKKRFKQRFVFLNNNEGWLMEKVLPETIINKEELPIATQNLNFKVL